MGFLYCRSPHWVGDDLSQCIRQKFAPLDTLISRLVLTPGVKSYLQILLPLTIAIISAIILFQKTIRNWIYGGNDGYRLLKDTLVDQLDNDADESEEDDFAEHLSLRHTISHQEFDIRENKPRDEIFRVASEEVMLMALVGIELAFLFTNTGHRDKIVHIAGLSTWVGSCVPNSWLGY